MTRSPLQEPQARGSKAGSVGGKDPRGCPGFVSQSQVGKAVCSFLRIVWCGKDDG